MNFNIKSNRLQMMMKKLLLCILCFCNGLLAFGQNKPTWVANRPVSEDYYIGIACVSKSEKDYKGTAEGKALSNLAAEIETQIIRHANIHTSENNQESQQQYDETIRILVDTKIQGIEFVDKWEDKKYYYVYYSLSKSKYEAFKATQLEKKKLKILDYINEGKKYESMLQMTDALRQFYWAKALLTAYGVKEEITLQNETGQEQFVGTWVDARLRNIFKNLSVKAGEAKSKPGSQVKNINLSIFYKGEKVVGSFDFHYFDGECYVQASAKDGKAIMECWFNPVEDFKIQCEYEFLSQAKRSNEEMFQALRQLALNGYADKDQAIQNGPAWITVERKNSEEPEIILQQQPLNPVKESKKTEMAALFTQLAVSDEDICKGIMKEVETAVNEKNLESVKQHFIPEGYDMFTRLIGFGNAVIADTASYQLIQAPDHIICRSIPVLFRFEKSNKEFIENVVFRFTPEKKISSLAFRLSELSELDIMGMKHWNETSRLILLEFIENYQTAYALERIDYLNDIFSDDALIIVGNVVKRTGISTDINLQKNQIVKVRKNKAEYISGLRECFSRNKYVHLHLSDCRVMRSGDSREIYGIQMKQEYESSLYADMGYLFLKVDLTHAERPQIYIRTWQEEKDPELVDGIYSLADFK